MDGKSYRKQIIIFYLLQLIILLLLLTNISINLKNIIYDYRSTMLFMHYPPKLTTNLLRHAYFQYAAYHESYMDVNQDIKKFTINNYFIHQIGDFAFFYLEHKPDTIKDKLARGERWESNLLKFMEWYVKKNSNVLDIGAHIGTHTIYFAKLLDGTGTVFAFEPQKKIFLELNANLFINNIKNVKTLRYAIGDKIGTIEMNPATQGNEGGTSVGHGGDKADLVSIDSLHISNISFIKIDVEGYEAYVLDGAMQTIKSNKPVILCEIRGVTNLDKDIQHDKEKIYHTLAKIKALGYQVTRVGDAEFLALPSSTAPLTR